MFLLSHWSPGGRPLPPVGLPRDLSLRHMTLLLKGIRGAQCFSLCTVNVVVRWSHAQKEAQIF